MAIVDPNIPNGPKMPSLGWNNGGTAAATRRGVESPCWLRPSRRPPFAQVAVTLRWVQRAPQRSTPAHEALLVSDKDGSAWSRSHHRANNQGSR